MQTDMKLVSITTSDHDLAIQVSWSIVKTYPAVGRRCCRGVSVVVDELSLRGGGNAYLITADAIRCVHLLALLILNLQKKILFVCFTNGKIKWLWLQFMSWGQCCLMTRCIVVWCSSTGPHAWLTAAWVSRGSGRICPTGRPLGSISCPLPEDN